MLFRVFSKRHDVRAFQIRKSLVVTVRKRLALTAIQQMLWMPLYKKTKLLPFAKFRPERPLAYSMFYATAIR